MILLKIFSQLLIWDFAHSSVLTNLSLCPFIMSQMSWILSGAGEKECWESPPPPGPRIPLSHNPSDFNKVSPEFPGRADPSPPPEECFRGLNAYPGMSGR